MKWNGWIALGSTSAGMSVALGAFAAHGLEARLEARTLDVFETGARYQMYHAIAMMVVGALMIRIETATFQVAGWAFLSGTFVFCGSFMI